MLLYNPPSPIQQLSIPCTAVLWRHCAVHNAGSAVQCTTLLCKTLLCKTLLNNTALHNIALKNIARNKTDLHSTDLKNYFLQSTALLNSATISLAGSWELCTGNNKLVTRNNIMIRATCSILVWLWKLMTLDLALKILLSIAIQCKVLKYNTTLQWSSMQWMQYIEFCQHSIPRSPRSQPRTRMAAGHYHTVLYSTDSTVQYSTVQ